MNTEHKYYILGNARQPQELDAGTWSNLDDLMTVISRKSGCRKLGKQCHKIALESYRVTKGYFCTLTVDGMRLITSRTLPLFDVQCEIQKHTGMTLSLCERIIKSAKFVNILILPNPYTEN